MKVFTRALMLAGALALVSVPGVARADWYVEAESLPTGHYTQAIGYGWGANGGAFLQLNWTGGPQYTAFTVGAAGAYQLHALLAGSVCSGYPVAAFYIDGYLRGRRPLGTGWSHQTSDSVWLGAGTHTFTVVFENDYAEPGVCDRNIWYDAAWMTGNTWR